MGNPRSQWQFRYRAISYHIPLLIMVLPGLVTSSTRLTNSRLWLRLSWILILIMKWMSVQYYFAAATPDFAPTIIINPWYSSPATEAKVLFKALYDLGAAAGTTGELALQPDQLWYGFILRQRPTWARIWGRTKSAGPARISADIERVSLPLEDFRIRANLHDGRMLFAQGRKIYFRQQCSLSTSGCQFPHYPLVCRCQSWQSRRKFWTQSQAPVAAEFRIQRGKNVSPAIFVFNRFSRTCIADKTLLVHRLWAWRWKSSCYWWRQLASIEATYASMGPRRIFQPILSHYKEPPMKR